MIQIKRVYDAPTAKDGYRILIDRLWPRGISKEKAHIDLWFKEIAPSTELRKWFNHDPEKWEEFQKSYQAEIRAQKEKLAELKAIIKREKNVTLLYSAADSEHNNAITLLHLLK